MDKLEIKKLGIRVLKGAGVAILTTLILLFIFSIILTYTSIQENIMKPVVIVISIISLLLGSSISTLKISKNGILNGGIIGIAYILIIYIFSSISGAGFGLNLESLIMIGLSIISGMVGGIIGVNM